MAASKTQRKLTAILCADVVGYSRLMGADEEATIETLTAYRKVFTSEIKKHRGRVVDAKGDAILAEFASVVDAVNSAAEIQRQLAEQNAAIPDDRRMDFRIGINLGDVVVKDDVIYGDGVNIAARLEALAEPAGICISRPVYDQVKSKINLEFEYLGEQQVKNIAEPVRAYSALMAPDGTAIRAPRSKQSVQATAVHDKPSIAVMPFDTMSDDPEQMYFADGIVEDIITELSKFRWFNVIARNTSFAYRGRPVDIRKVAQELRVGYVMEGSVRKLGERARITAQLIEAATGNHVWAESYDCEMSSIFDVQDDITAQIVGSVNPELYSAEVKHARQKSTENLDAWSYAVRGRWHVTRLTKDDAVEAKRYLTKALELNPNHVAVLAFMAYSHITDVFFGLSASPPESIKQAMELSQQAISLDENDPWAQCARGMAMFVGKDQDKAIAHYRRAIELNPNFAIAYGYLSLVLAHAGEPLPAIEAGEKAIHLSPRDPELLHFYVGIGTAHFIAGDYAEAVNWAEKVIQVRPNVPSGYRLRAASLAYLGEIDRARKSLHEMLGLVPHATASLLRNAIHFKNPEDSDRYIEGLRKAGLPE